jgi:hypothetical protein
MTRANRSAAGLLSNAFNDDLPAFVKLRGIILKKFEAAGARTPRGVVFSRLKARRACSPYSCYGKTKIIAAEYVLDVSFCKLMQRRRLQFDVLA